MAQVEDYVNLVALRKSCRCCAGLTNPADVREGHFDSDEIGPWSRWQGNLAARLMVVGQDWGDTNYYIRHSGVEGPNNPTNTALANLLVSIEIAIGPPGAAIGQDVVFFTNAILCLKSGGLQAPVQDVWFRNCALYLQKQIEIVQPSVVVGLGVRPFRSVLRSFGLPVPRGPHRKVVEDPEGTLLPNGSRLFAVYHCGARIRNSLRDMDAQLNDWARIRRFLRSAG